MASKTGPYDKLYDDAERKRRKKERDRSGSKRKVFVRNQFERWSALEGESGVKTHEEWARLLTGIGRGLVEGLLKCGAETFALSRTKADLDSLKAEFPAVHTVHVDVSDWDDTRKAVQSLGPIDLLVNNAGIAVIEKFEDVTKEVLDRTFDINLKAVFNVSQIVAKGIIERGSEGAIVNISSQASKIALPGHTVYSATKGGLDSLTKVMALELGPHKIRVNAVNPTFTLTPLARKVLSDTEFASPQMSRIPMARFGEVQDVVDPVLFLLSDKAAMIHGTTLPIDGGRLAN